MPSSLENTDQHRVQYHKTKKYAPILVYTHFKVVCVTIALFVPSFTSLTRSNLSDYCTVIGRDATVIFGDTRHCGLVSHECCHNADALDRSYDAPSGEARFSERAADLGRSVLAACYPSAP